GASRAWHAPPSLYENPWTIPDMLSMRRIGLAPVLGYLFNIALRVFALAGLTALAKYFNPCSAITKLKPTFISKVSTAVQLILVAASLIALVFNYAHSTYLQILPLAAQLHQLTVTIIMLRMLV
ncbi:hypothetical protein HPG69_010101, partial [Diceros bicornis minor]